MPILLYLHNLIYYCIILQYKKVARSCIRLHFVRYNKNGKSCFCWVQILYRTPTGGTFSSLLSHYLLTTPVQSYAYLIIPVLWSSIIFWPTCFRLVASLVMTPWSCIVGLLKVINWQYLRWSNVKAYFKCFKILFSINLTSGPIVLLRHQL